MINLSRRTILLLGFLIGLLLAGMLAFIATTLIAFNAPWLAEVHSSLTPEQLGAKNWAADKIAINVRLGLAANSRGGEQNDSENEEAPSPPEAPMYHPEDIIFDGNYLWISDFGKPEEDANGHVLIFDPNTFETVNSVEVGASPYGMAYDGRYFWVINSGDNTLTKIDSLGADGYHAAISKEVVTETLTATLDSPRWATFDGTYVWVSNQEADYITAVPAKPFVDELSTIEVGKSPRGVLFDGFSLWIAVSGTGEVVKMPIYDMKTGMEVEDSYSGENLQRIELGGSPRGLTFDGANIWVSNYELGTVSKIRASDGAVLATFDVGLNPWGIGFDGTRIYVANNGDMTVSILRATDGQEVETFPADENPTAFAFDGTHMWLTNWGSGTVTRR